MFFLQTLIFFLSFVFISISISGYGCLIKLNVKKNFLLNIFLGFIVISFIVTFVHFFFNINLLISFLIFFTGISIFLTKKKEIFITFLIKKLFTISLFSYYLFRSICHKNIMKILVIIIFLML